LKSASQSAILGRDNRTSQRSASGWFSKSALFQQSFLRATAPGGTLPGLHLQRRPASRRTHQGSGRPAGRHRDLSPSGPTRSWVIRQCPARSAGRPPGQQPPLLVLRRRQRHHITARQPQEPEEAHRSRADAAQPRHDDPGRVSSQTNHERIAAGQSRSKPKISRALGMRSNDSGGVASTRANPTTS